MAEAVTLSLTYLPMNLMQTILTVRTPGAGLHEFTSDVAHFVRESGAQQGLLTLFVQHTSCSLLVQENADPDVKRDLSCRFERSRKRWRSDRRLHGRIHPGR